jgi:PKD repeat protein
MKKLLVPVLFALLFAASCAKQSAETDAPTTDLKPVTTDLNNGCNDNCGAHTIISAGFSIDNLNGTVREQEDLQISDLCQNAASYEWDFGNGDKVYQPVPVYRYPKCGTYVITLTVKNAKGESAQTSQEIVVTCL